MTLLGTRRSRAWTMVVVAAVLVAGFLGQSRFSEAEKPQPRAATPGVPVTVTKVGRRDIDVFDRGIGTVTAFRSVTVRAQVAGYLAKINFTEGKTVTKGELLAEIDKRPYQAALDQAMAKKAADAAQLQNAQLNLSRYATLSKQDFVSRQQLDTTKAQVNQFKATIEGDDAAIEAAKLNLDYCDLRAPFDGVVGFRQIDIGNLIEPTNAQGIATVTEIHPIAVLFPLPQEDMAAIQEAMAAGTPRVLAFSSDGKKQLSVGSLLARNNQVDTSTGTITIKAEFANADNKLWPGEFVQARLRIRTDRNMVVVRRSAVQHGPDGLYVYLVKPDQTATMQAVTVGYQNDKDSEILTGLKGGEELVTAGQSRLQDGTRVNAKQAPSS